MYCTYCVWCHFSDIPMTFEETSYFAVVNPVATIVICPLCSYLLSAIGRKWHMVLVFVPHFSSWMLIAFAMNSIMLYASRALGGFAEAILLLTISVYVGEVTEKRLRGLLGCIPTISFFLGKIVMNAVGYYLTINTAALVMSGFSIIHLLLFIWMPESPYWLIEKNRLEEARKELQILRWRSNVDEEFDEIEQAVKRQMSEKGSYKDLFVDKGNRKAFIIAAIARTAQLFSGINAFMTYLQYIFKEAGGDLPSHISSIICMSLLTIGAIIGSRFIDVVGRKLLFNISCYGCILALLFQTIYFCVQEKIDTSPVSWLPLVFMICYIAMYSVGLSIIPAVLIGELFSASIKPKAVLLMVMVYSSGTLVSAKLFQGLVDNVSLYAPFLFFTLATILLTVIISFIFVETKNKTLEEIQQDLKGNTS